jgi:lipopolysaccharide/colanic/teichoic acid biosynthesis glycosyltransferase
MSQGRLSKYSLTTSKGADPCGTSGWCFSVGKRFYDLVFSTLGLLILSPLISLVALLVKFSDSGPVFFRQVRVGQGGRHFRIWKFRTMVVDAEHQGSAVTSRGDPRITKIGCWLRKKKLDELPQVWNVFIGDMSFVGPRPEVPQYVAKYTAEQRQVLKLKPGITDLATIQFRHEEDLLRNATDVEKTYLENCLPLKIRSNLYYARRASLWRDTKIILQTLVPKLRIVGEFANETELNDLA